MALRKSHDTIPEALKSQVDRSPATTKRRIVSRSMPIGNRGRWTWTSPRQPSILRPRQACSIMKRAPEDQACGRQATG